MRMHLDKPMPLLKEPINCSWCSRKLQGHVQRRNGNLYCNDTCSNQGEERRLRYVAALAGTVNSHYLIGACALIIFMVAFTIFGGSKAFAQEQRHHGHMEHHENAYSKWMKPHKPNESCCNMKVVKANGEITGDCYPTRSRNVRNRDGWRLIAQKDDGNWVEIPDYVILRRTINPDESGVSSHICESHNVIHCFLESTGIM
jgi:hypothetical protein